MIFSCFKNTIFNFRLFFIHLNHSSCYVLEINHSKEISNRCSQTRGKLKQFLLVCSNYPHATGKPNQFLVVCCNQLLYDLLKLESADSEVKI